MYFPYFRGKQYELICLRTSASLLKSKKIHPIVEPVRDLWTQCDKMLQALSDHNIGCTLVANPRIGDHAENPNVVLEYICTQNLFKNGIHWLGYIIENEHDFNQIEQYVSNLPHAKWQVFHSGANLQPQQIADKCLGFPQIESHVFRERECGRSYVKAFKDCQNRVVLADSFPKQSKNSEYKMNIIELFSDVIEFYKSDGYTGFGDYLTIGDLYSEGGGNAKFMTVAIHITLRKSLEDLIIYIQHFTSQDNQGSIMEKFQRALDTLITDYNSPNSLIYHTNAMEEFKRLWAIEHFPGLGKIKQLSMQHHLELMDSILIEKR
jgi:hypothetical protein